MRERLTAGEAQALLEKCPRCEGKYKACPVCLFLIFIRVVFDEESHAIYERFGEALTNLEIKSGKNSMKKLTESEIRDCIREAFQS